MAERRSYANNKIKITLNTSVRRKVEDLTDVDVTDRNNQDGGTLVYDQSANTFVLRGITSSGGTF